MMAKWRTCLIGLSLAIVTACGAPAPVPTSVLPASTPTVMNIPTRVTTAHPTATRLAGPAPTIAVAMVDTLPPIVVTNPLPSVTPWPTPIPPTADAVYVATATAIANAPTSTPVMPTCPPLPTPSVESTAAAVQHFETGLMFWLQTRNEIWVLIQAPTANQFYWRVLPNQWSEGIAELDPNLKPPADRYQPVRGFGYAWRIGSGSTDAQRPDLGWAIDEEVGYQATVVYYPQGFYSPDCTWEPKSGIYELRDDRGQVYRFVGEGGVANLVTP